MSIVTVGISDCGVSGDSGCTLLTYALGSCVAVTVHDPVAGVAGLLHFMLPDAAIDQIKAARNPFMFADTGIPRLLREAIQCGANRRRLIARIVGGAQILDGPDRFHIGLHNYRAARKLLSKEGLLVAAEVVGGEGSRTVRVEVRTGKTWIREAGVEWLMRDTIMERNRKWPYPD